MDGNDEELCNVEFTCYSVEYFSIFIYHFKTYLLCNCSFCVVDFVVVSGMSRQCSSNPSVRDTFLARETNKDTLTLTFDNIIIFIYFF